MKRKIDEDLDRLTEIYNEDRVYNGKPFDESIEDYKDRVRQQDEKYKIYDDTIPSHNKYDRIPLQHTIDRMKASYEEVAERYRNNKGKKYTSWNPDDY